VGPTRRIPARWIRVWSTSPPIAPSEYDGLVRFLNRLQKRRQPTLDDAAAIVTRLDPLIVRSRRITLATWIFFGWVLIRAKAALAHGQFLALFQGEKTQLPVPLSLTEKDGQKLMRLARDPELVDPKILDNIPQSFHLADDLLRLKRKLGTTLKQLIEERKVHRHTRSKDIEALADGQSLTLSARYDPDDNPLGTFKATYRQALTRYFQQDGDRAVLFQFLAEDLARLKAADTKDDAEGDDAEDA
jgi:hypothetical protein